jgi:hypothetical protein
MLKKQKVSQNGLILGQYCRIKDDCTSHCKSKFRYAELRFQGGVARTVNFVAVCNAIFRAGVVG